MSEETIMLDTPESIRAFAYLQVYYKLKLEVENPKGPKWRDSPMKQARQILMSHNVALGVRTRRQTFVDYKAFLVANGILQEKV